MISFVAVFISSLRFPRLKFTGIKALLLLVRGAGHWLHTFHIWVTNILVSPNFLQLHENNMWLYLPTTTSCILLDPAVIQHSDKTEHVAEAEHKQVKANAMVREKSLSWICDYIFVCSIRFKPAGQYFFVSMFRYVSQTDQSLLCSEPGWLSIGQFWRKYTLLSIWVYWVKNNLEPMWVYGFC